MIKKERILLVNKFYYPRGGDCMVTLNLEKLLKSKGHDVATFSMQHSQNIESQYSPYFPNEYPFSGNIKNKVNAANGIWYRYYKNKIQSIIIRFSAGYCSPNLIFTLTCLP